MGHYSKAESYFQFLLQLLPKGHEDLASTYNHIGDLHMRITNWNEAFKYFNLAYKIKNKRFRDSNNLCMAMSLNNIGNYYSAIDDFDKALNFYKKALKCKNEQVNNAITLLNISRVYNRKGDYDKALKLCIEVRDQLQENEPTLYVEIIHCHGIIGDIYFNQGKFKESKGFYLVALLIAQKYLVIGDLLQINCIKALVELYEKQINKQRAINFLHKQLSIYSVNVPQEHLSIAQLLIIKGKLCDNDNKKQIRCYKKALNVLEKNIHSEYASLANCLMLIGQYYEREQMNKEAGDYYKRANEIQKKIYPIKHSILFKTQDLIISVENMY